MTDEFPVEKVKPEWMVGSELMGTKRKFWYRHPDTDGPDQLFKYAQQNTGEHWAEKIAAEVASALEIPHANVELAEIEAPGEQENGSRGTATESFSNSSTDLIHGNQIMALMIFGYEEDLAKFHQSDHTFTNIKKGLDIFFETPDTRKEAYSVFASYIVLDALISNVDRHHENWAVQVSFSSDGLNIEIAPSFDHASSLGRELRDGKRELFLNEGGVPRYSEKGKGGIYWAEADRRGPSPLQLVRLVALEEPDMVKPALRLLNPLQPSELEAIVNRIPNCWMSPISRRFALELVYYNLSELKKLLHEIE